jgi:hypothetical protein
MIELARSLGPECFPGERCPFSARAVAEARLPEATARELIIIYRECGGTKGGMNNVNGCAGTAGSGACRRAAASGGERVA